MIREVDVHDAEPLSFLMGELGYPTNRRDMKVRLQTILADDSYQTYVYQEEKRLLGMIGMSYSLAYHTTGTHVRVISFVVEESSQGKGIGRLLMEKAEDWARMKKANRLILNSGNRKERKGAHSVYEKLGFEGKATGFYKDI
ncbi:GNAT family N-acetyltransferase [Halobacillus seohaensis]|uniref:GNAT family N-acetyltransferase n=1 Tax=Halobacillus seohaensis TaxID=447421 RepID=A0ABW2EMX3_9BACI